jgi:hypothetical protein
MSTEMCHPYLKIAETIAPALRTRPSISGHPAKIISNLKQSTNYSASEVFGK